MQAQQLQVPKVKIPQPEQQIPQLVQVQQQAPPPDAVNVKQKSEMMWLQGNWYYEFIFCNPTYLKRAIDLERTPISIGPFWQVGFSHAK